MRKNVLVESDAGKHFNEGPALPQRSSLRCCVHFYRYEQEESRTWNPRSPGLSLFDVDNAIPRHRLWIAACFPVFT